MGTPARHVILKKNAFADKMAKITLNSSERMNSTQTPLTADQVQAFNDDGYLVLRQFFGLEQMQLLDDIAKADKVMDDADELLDSEGAVSRISCWNDLQDDIYSAFACNERIVAASEQLMGDEVYHFHHKMVLKEPRVGGAWEWHQDFGYWYLQQHVLFPDMLSAAIAVDAANQENGCLQVLRGSHKCGRIEHGSVGDQTGADMEKVQALLDFYKLEHVYVALDPGDVLFFHCNTLHRSDQNRSERSRWSLICCYNTRHNDKYGLTDDDHPAYRALERWPDEKVLELGKRDHPSHQQPESK